MKTFIVFLTLLFVFSSCKKGEYEPFYRELQLYAQYTNTDNPTIVLDDSKTSAQIQLNANNVSSTIENNRAIIKFNEVRFLDQLGTYQVNENEIVTEEYNNGKWKVDVENFFSATKSNNLDIVLVLDLSTSLGNDVYTLKEYAKNFVDAVLSSGSRIGVVTFSLNTQTLDLTQSSSSAKQFISSASTANNETALYLAMNAGIDLLTKNDDNRTKILLTFTDGINNSWGDQESLYRTIDYTLNRLKTPLSNGRYISSYTIGLKGKSGIEEAALISLALNGGRCAFPNSMTDLQTIFNKFANTVSASYFLTYNRNSSKVTEPILLRFRIKAKLF